MTVAKISIEKHEKGVGWYRVTITALPNFIGETKIEMLLREETLRQFRQRIDRALSKKQNHETPEFLKKDK